MLCVPPKRASAVNRLIPALRPLPRQSIRLGVSCRFDPTNDASVRLTAVDPRTPDVDGRTLKLWAYRQMCERARGGKVVRYGPSFPGVPEADRISRCQYDTGDSYAWLWKNESRTRVFTEEVRAPRWGGLALRVSVFGSECAPIPRPAH